MPTLDKKKDRRCAICFSYRLGPGNPGDDAKDPNRNGGPYCKHFKTYFPDHNKWIYNRTAKKPGERVCKFFKNRGGK